MRFMGVWFMSHEISFLLEAFLVECNKEKIIQKGKCRFSHASLGKSFSSIFPLTCPSCTYFLVIVLCVEMSVLCSVRNLSGPEQFLVTCQLSENEGPCLRTHFLWNVILKYCKVSTVHIQILWNQKYTLIRIFRRRIDVTIAW